MKKKIIVLFALVLANSLYASWPMESIENYNVLLLHGAYGAEKFFFQRVMKTSVVVNGANAVSEFEYCDNSCPLPGPLYC